MNESIKEVLAILFDPESADTSGFLWDMDLVKHQLATSWDNVVLLTRLLNTKPSPVTYQEWVMHKSSWDTLNTVIPLTYSDYRMTGEFNQDRLNRDLQNLVLFDYGDGNGSVNLTRELEALLLDYIDAVWLGNPEKLENSKSFSQNPMAITAGVKDPISLRALMKQAGGAKYLRSLSRAEAAKALHKAAKELIHERKKQGDNYTLNAGTIGTWVGKLPDKSRKRIKANLVTEDDLEDAYDDLRDGKVNLLQEGAANDNIPVSTIVEEVNKSLKGNTDIWDMGSSNAKAKLKSAGRAVQRNNVENAPPTKIDDKSIEEWLDHYAKSNGN